MHTNTGVCVYVRLYAFMCVSMHIYAYKILQHLNTKIIKWDFLNAT